jgi:hypothetical protein
MSSDIDPNSIDPTFPTADQNNDSQGFRDNFQAIQTNFDKAKEEITNLQETVIGITGPIFSTSAVQLTGPIVSLNTQFKTSDGDYTLTFPGTGAV